jgi:LPXTG-motif cell wall-anchored protein
VIRTLLVSLAAAALLALAPAAALAQDSGSQQYQDPLAGDTPNPAPNTGGGGGSSGGNRNSTAQTQAATTRSDSASSNGSELPRTGLDALLLLLAGTALLGGGLALRRVADRTGA